MDYTLSVPRRPGRPPKGHVRAVYYLPPALRDQLRQAAIADGADQSRIVADAITQYLARRARRIARQQSLEAPP